MFEKVSPRHHKHDPVPVEEMIEHMEASEVHGMDDRVSLSSEDSMIVRDDEKGSRHFVSVAYIG